MATSLAVQVPRTRTGPGALRDIVGRKSAADSIADLVTSHEVDLQRLEAGYIRKSRRRLRDLEKDLDRQLTRIDPTSPQSVTFRQKRLEKLKQSTQESIRKSYSASRDEVKKDLRDFSRVEAEGYQRVIDRGVGIGPSRLSGNVQVSLFDVTPSAGTLRQIVDGTLIEGTPLSDHWSRQSRRTRERFESQMAIGVLQGEDLGALRQRLRGTPTGRYQVVTRSDGRKVREQIYEGGLMTTSRREADALIRTATQSVANRVRDDMIKSNPDVAKGRQALVVLDNRTTEICMSRSGHAWDLNDAPIPDSGAASVFPGPPPWHVNCRTVLVPVLRSWVELAGPRSTISREKLARLESAGTRTQASMDGQVGSDLNYERWLKTKPKSFQNEVLGKGKADLWRRGKIKSFSELVDQTGRPITLRQFRERAGLDPSTGKPVRRRRAQPSGRAPKASKEEYTVSLPGGRELPAPVIKAVIKAAKEYVWGGYNWRRGTWRSPLDRVRSAPKRAKKKAVRKFVRGVAEVRMNRDALRRHTTVTVVPGRGYKPQVAAEDLSALSDNGIAAVLRRPNGPPSIDQYIHGPGGPVYKRLAEYQTTVSKPTRAYFGPDYGKVTKAIHEGGKLPRDVQKIVDAIDADALPLSAPMVAFRGAANASALTRAVTPGDVIPSLGPFSLTMSPSVAVRGAHRRTKTGREKNLRKDSVLVVAKLEEGQRAVLANPVWQEVTIPQGHHLRVDAVHRNSTERLRVGNQAVPLPPTIIEATVVKIDDVIKAAPPKGITDSVPTPATPIAPPKVQAVVGPVADSQRIGGLAPVRVVGDEGWCGPCVISSITGETTAVAANRIRAQRGWPEGSGEVIATNFGEVRAAVQKSLDPSKQRISDNGKHFLVGETTDALNGPDVSAAAWARAKGEGRTAAVVWLPATQEFHWVALSRQADEVFAVDNGVLVGTNPVNVKTVRALNQTGDDRIQVLGYFRVEDVADAVTDNGVAVMRTKPSGKPEISRYLTKQETMRAYHQLPQYNPTVNEFVGDYFLDSGSVTKDFRAGRLSRQTKRIDTAITEASRPLTQPLTVFRGMRSVDRRTLRSMQPGSVLPTYGPFSTSLDPSVAVSFAGAGTATGDVLLAIRLPEGQRIVASNTMEQEITVPSGHGLLVERVHKNASVEIERAGSSTGPAVSPSTIVEATVVKIEPPAIRVGSQGAPLPEGFVRSAGGANATQKANNGVAAVVQESGRAPSIVQMVDKKRATEIHAARPGYNDSPSPVVQSYLGTAETGVGQSPVYAQVAREVASGEVSPQTARVMHAIGEEATPLPDSMVVFRGTTITPDMKPGQVLNSNQPFSASASSSEAIRHVENTKGVKVQDRAVMVLNLPRGQRAIVTNADVQEVVVPSGYSIRIDAVHRNVPKAQRKHGEPANIVEATVVKVDRVDTEPAAIRASFFKKKKKDAEKKKENSVSEVEPSGPKPPKLKSLHKTVKSLKGAVSKLPWHQGKLPKEVTNFTQDYPQVTKAYMTNNAAEIAKVKPLVDSITDASLPLDKDTVLFRGISDVTDLVKKVQPGQNLNSAGAPFFATLDVADAAAYAAVRHGKDSRPDAALFVINAPKGTLVASGQGLGPPGALTIPEGYSMRVDKVHRGVNQKVFKEKKDGLGDTVDNIVEITLVRNTTEAEVESNRPSKVSKVDRASDAYKKDKNLDGLDLKDAKFKDGTDLSGASLKNANLGGAELREVSASGADLSGATLKNAQLDKANLSRADFVNADAKGVSLKGANVTEVDFADSNLQGARLDRAQVQGSRLLRTNADKATMVEADLSKAQVLSSSLKGSKMDDVRLRSATIEGSDFSDADLNRANLTGAVVKDSNFNRTELTHSTLSGTDVQAVSFAGAKANGISISTSRVQSSSFAGAKMKEANVSSSTIKGVDFDGADLTKSKWDNVEVGGSSFANANLKNSKFEAPEPPAGQPARRLDASFEGANLDKTLITNFDMKNNNFSGARLREAHLEGVDASNADFSKSFLLHLDAGGATGSKFDGANFSGSNMGFSDFSQTTMVGAKLDGADVKQADFRATDLRQASLDDLDGVKSAKWNGSMIDAKNAEIFEDLPKWNRPVTVARSESLDLTDIFYDPDGNFAMSRPKPLSDEDALKVYQKYIPEKAQKNGYSKGTQEYFTKFYRDVTKAYETGEVSPSVRNTITSVIDDAAPIANPTKVFRGMGLSADDLVKLLDEGQTIPSRGPFSTSLDPDVSRAFAHGAKQEIDKRNPKANAHSVMFELNLNAGQRVVAGNAAEMEITIPPGHGIRVGKLQRVEDVLGDVPGMEGIDYIVQATVVRTNAPVLPKSTVPKAVRLERAVEAQKTKIFAGLDMSELELKRFDLDTATFSGADLRGVSISNSTAKLAQFNKTVADDARIDGLDLTGTAVKSSSFKNATINKSKMTGSVIDKSDFTDATLTELHAPGVNISQTNFSRAKIESSSLSSSNIKGSTFAGAEADQVNFSSAKIDSTSFAGAKMKDSVFHLAKLDNVDFSEADLLGTDFDQVSWGGTASFARAKANVTKFKGKVGDPSKLVASFESADLQDSFFKDMDISSSNFKSTKMESTTFVDVKAKNADFSNANLKEFRDDGLNTDFSGSSFKGADLQNSRFPSTTMRDVDLTDANVRGAHFAGADLRGANLAGMKNVETANWKGAFVDASQEGVFKDVKKNRPTIVYKEESLDLMRVVWGPNGDLIALKQKVNPLTDESLVVYDKYKAMHQTVHGKVVSRETQNYFTVFYRQVTRAYERGKASDEVLATVKAIIADSVPLPNSTKVFRGMGLTAEFVQENLIPGNTLPTRGPFSTSLASNQAEIFANSKKIQVAADTGKPGVGVLFILDLHSGQKIVAANQAEREITIPPGHGIRVDKVQKLSGRIEGLRSTTNMVVQATVVKTDVPLLPTPRAIPASEAALKIDLVDAALATESKNLSGAVLEGVALKHKDLSNVNLSGAKLAGADLKGTSLSAANLAGADLPDANLVGANAGKANFQGANLQEADLKGASLRQANFKEANLVKANLENASLLGADLTLTSLEGAALQNSNLENALLSTTSLQNANLENVGFKAASIEDTSFLAANLKNSDFKGANISHTKFTSAEMQGSDFQGASFDAVSFSNAKLRDANFKGVDLAFETLPSADLRKANLQDADLKFANVELSNLEGANLHKTNLRSANMSSTNLTEANLTGANLRNANLRTSTFKEADLRDAILDEANLKGATFELTSWHKTSLKGAYLEKVDLRGALFNESNFDGANLKNANLRDADLTDSTMKKAKLKGADLRGAALSRAQLVEADLDGANLGGANLRGANLDKVDLRETKLAGANLREARLQGADLAYADLRETVISHADFKGASLQGVKFHEDINSVDFAGASLRKANFENATLYGTTFLTKADLQEANFRGAIMAEARLKGANLHKANFEGADLNGTNFRDAIMVDANFKNANLERADFTGNDNLLQSSFAGANLQRAQLSGADFRGVILVNADLRFATIRDAKLDSAQLGGADLRDLVFSGVSLRGADLRNADLSGANLIGVDLTGANLTGANLTNTTIDAATALNLPTTVKGKPKVVGRAESSDLHQIIWDPEDNITKISLLDGNFSAVYDKYTKRKAISSEAHRYFTSFYREVTDAYTDGRFSDDVAITVHALVDSAVSLSAPTTVFRGMGLPAHVVESSLVPGAILPARGPFSTSLLPDLSVEFANGAVNELLLQRGERSASSVLFVLTLGKGQKYVAGNADEMELTIPPGYAIRVDRVSSKKGFLVDTAEEAVDFVVEATVVLNKTSDPLPPLPAAVTALAKKKTTKKKAPKKEKSLPELTEELLGDAYSVPEVETLLAEVKQLKSKLNKGEVVPVEEISPNLQLVMSIGEDIIDRLAPHNNTFLEVAEEDLKTVMAAAKKTTTKKTTKKKAKAKAKEPELSPALLDQVTKLPLAPAEELLEFVSDVLDDGLKGVTLKDIALLEKWGIEVSSAGKYDEGKLKKLEDALLEHLGLD